MNMNEDRPVDHIRDYERQRAKKQVVGTFLFFANWLFAVSSDKRFIGPPEGDSRSMRKNFATALLALAAAGPMIRLLSRDVAILLFPAVVALALAVALD